MAGPPIRGSILFEEESKGCKGATLHFTEVVELEDIRQVVEVAKLEDVPLEETTGGTLSEICSSKLEEMVVVEVAKLVLQN